MGQSTINFQKIKLKEGAVTLEFEEIKTFEEKNEVGEDVKYTEGTDVTLTRRILAHRDFFDAMSALKKHVCVLCEFFEDIDQIPETYLASLTVTGISLGGHDEYEGVTVVAQKKLKSGKVLNLVTPFTRFVDEENPDAYPYGFELASAVGVVENEASLFLGGKKAQNAQLELNFGEDSSEPEASVRVMQMH